MQSKSDFRENEVFRTSVSYEGIIHVHVKEKAKITVDHAEENTRFVIELSGGEILPMLVDTRNILTISKEARDHFSMKDREGKVNAIAILIGNPLSKIVGNFFLGLNKPKVPTKLFTDEKQAHVWLEQFL